jgi:tRNA(fMet)-specific endonuclease VapC
MTHLLDTNACIVHIRSPQSGPVHQHLSLLKRTEVVLCSVVVAELLYGALHSGNPARNLSKIQAFLQLFKSLPFDDAAAQYHAEVRQHLAKQGIPIGPHDLQIAAIALQNNLTVVTNNTSEFSRVPGLKCEDWQIP